MLLGTGFSLLAATSWCTISAKVSPQSAIPWGISLLFLTVTYFALVDMLLIIFSRHFMCVFVSLVRLWSQGQGLSCCVFPPLFLMCFLKVLWLLLTSINKKSTSKNQKFSFCLLCSLPFSLKLSLIIYHKEVLLAYLIYSLLVPWESLWWGRERGE